MNKMDTLACKFGKWILCIVALFGAMTQGRAQMASDALVAFDKANILPYDISAPGVSMPVRWGIDTAWMWSWWPLRATNHMRECVSLGRVTIDPRTSGTYTSLSDEQKAHFDEQLSWLEKSGVKLLYLLTGNASGTPWQTSYRTPFIKDIELGVTYLQEKGYEVTAIVLFNESDYSANNAPNATEMATVARLVRQNSVMSSIDVAGPNCLNPDYAAAWWNTMKGSVQIGNTHQLAGTFDNFANFYAAVKAAGKKGAGDEMHNVNDALIGMNYGMTDGIWWSDFGSYTRAELGRASNDGERIGYAENRAAWTSAAVFRRKSEPLVEAFLGTSERQAAESAYTFVSQDRLAYYDGYGPYYEYTKATPGGTGYQSGQTNAECVVEITHGEDVQVGPVSGTFKIVNKATGKLLTAASLAGGADISQARESKTALQTWVVKAIAPRQAADMAHVTITAATNETYYLDALKYDADNGAKVQMYAGNGNECERWHLHYKGNGYYVITNYDSGLSLEGSSNGTSGNTTGVVQWERTGSDRQLWRFVPADATVETRAPGAPTKLRAQGLPGSISLKWQECTDDDLLGYMVYRCDEETGVWETVGRQVKGAQFIDNYCVKGRTYRYRVRAVDAAWNIGEASSDVTATTVVGNALIGHWPLSANVADISGNKLDGVAANITYATTEGHECAVFNGSTSQVCLPYNVGDMEQMTFAAWVRIGSTTAWQRIFDFGRSETDYVMLTPSNGSRLRFEICKDGVKQGVNATKRLSTGTWTHVAVTLGKEGAKIYLDGVLNASSTSVTYRPSDVHPVLTYLGKSMFGSDPLLNGSLADVRLYNYELTAAEIKSLTYDEVNEAVEMLGNAMNKSVRNALQEALDAAREAISGGDATAITQAIANLTAGMQAAQPSVEAYRPLVDALEWSKDMAAAYPQDDTEAGELYAQEYGEAEEECWRGDIDDSAIPEAVIAVRIFTNGYLMADARQETTKFTDITHLITNADFSTGDTQGWKVTTGDIGYEGTVAYECLELRERTFDITQQIYGMPRGTYKLQAQGFYRNGPKENAASTDVNAYLFMENDQTEIAPISLDANRLKSEGTWYAYVSGKYVPDDQQAAAAACNIRNRYLPKETVNTLTCSFMPDMPDVLTIGMRKTVEVADDWTVVNKFVLLYQAPGETGIILREEVRGKREESMANEWYDLTGRRLNGRPTKSGFYIQGGKKVFVE